MKTPTYTYLVRPLQGDTNWFHFYPGQTRPIVDNCLLCTSMEEAERVCRRVNSKQWPHVAEEIPSE